MVVRPDLTQKQKKALQLNVTVVITPQSLADAIRQLVANGVMDRHDAIEYVHEMIDTMNGLLQELYTAKRIKI